jgi:hypothetical protein
MTGLLCLQGGREFTSDCLDMDATVLDRVDGGRVAVLAGAARMGADHDGAVDRARRHYESLGAEVIGIPDPRTDLRGALTAMSADIGLFVLPGGSPSSLFDVLAGATPVVGQRLTELHAVGAAISGASAGAMVLCSRLFRPEHGDVVDGLGLVDGLALPHWTPGSERRWPTPADIDLWGLPECGGALLTTDATVAVGRGEPARRCGGTWTPLPRELESGPTAFA